MKPYKSIVYAFFIGGMFALIAQAILSFWQFALAGTPMEFFMGGATLVSMGVIGCVLGGFAVYQYVEEWGDFGALLPFSGFAMAVGMKAVGPWTKSNEKFGKCVWNCVWFVVWFNVLFAAICIAIGYVCGMLGLNNPVIVVEKTTGGMLFFWAFVVGGILAAIFQLLYIIVQKITPKVNHLHILITAWMVGCILAPCGISTALMNFSGEGFGVMITVGGYNMYNVGLDLFMGHVDGALLHLGSFALAVCGLAITALFTFFIYNAKYGRTPLRDVHKQKALHSLEELGFEAALTDKAAAPAPAKKAAVVEAEDLATA
ncbi:SpoVA/SpoVAEb family sporulation membrane protein [Adlercreutzia sp. ZJ242]|uniref:SpoVA/SpoVAEb family sporulation membrane protein n=1 Tax=Adlercreutzia sp. ZJ242 TaxID=2709409 RepID=UPI0013EC9BE9|nr:SpoVA/SpoVAEb family sporulation membrane protein [Adlercreutzia sp. ZJ242]